ncbi:MAG: 23S rRNA (pseudouridine(1915)-N(3))-methyltransferase RlmH [Defluviitaleaceae bacterium]|nr:23S rRNA (pseudouridine(1915)-N(3))-methyltransferase RlmH [Defluviitaleaceae bacterium]
MTKITFITVGKLKEQYFRDAVSEYTKRLSKYTKFEIIEIHDEPLSEKMSLAREQTILRKEGERILKNIKESGYVIITAISGTMLNSTAFAEKITKLALEGHSHIYFIIGGSLGLSLEVVERADFSLSFSKMTFPHQLMRVILAEQVYRAFRINNNEPYHK